MYVQLRKEAEAALARISLRDALKEGFNVQFGEDDSDEQESKELIPLTFKQKQEREEKHIRDLQQQWEEIQFVRWAAYVYPNPKP